MNARLKALNEALGTTGTFAPPQSRAIYMEFAKTMPRTPSGGGQSQKKGDKKGDEPIEGESIGRKMRDIDDAKAGAAKPASQRQAGVDALRSWMSR